MRYLLIGLVGTLAGGLLLGSLLFGLETGGAALTLAALLVAWPTVIHPIARDGALGPLLAVILVWEACLIAFHVFWLIPFYGPAALDSFGYHNAAVEVAGHMRSGQWRLIPSGLGNHVVVVATALLYALFGPSLQAMFIIAAALGLGGTLLFYRAFAVWQSPRQARQYALVLLFLPSLGVWRSLYGKDSVVIFGLGVTCWGYSVWLARARAGALLWACLGVGLIGLVRPHVAVAVAVSLLATEGWRRGSHRGAVILKTIVGLALFAPILVTLGSATRQYVSLQQESVAGLLEIGATNARYNAIGGSALAMPDVSTPLDLARFLPEGLVRLLLRPFLWEAHNANAWLAALENLFLLGFFLRSLPALPASLRGIRRRPYYLFVLLMAAELSLMFCLLTNLGLISRMKTMIYPFLFALLLSASRRPVASTRSWRGPGWQVSRPAPMPGLAGGS